MLRSRFFNYSITKFPNYSIFLGFLQLHHKALEFRGVRVGVDYRGREAVKQRSRIAVFVLLNATITLVNRDTNLVDLFAVNRHRLDSFGDEGFRYVVTPRAGHLYFIVAF